MDNSTEAIHEFCSKDWNLDFNSIFHGGNILLGLGYLIPQDFELSILALRSMTMIGFGFMVIWSLETVCGFDLFLYNLLFLVINTIYTGLLIKRHFPVFIPEHQKELFKKVFEPMKISKKDFHLLMRDSTTQTVRGGKTFAIENDTKCGDKLRILLSGKMAVSCDEVFLHFIQPLEFVDSLEFRSRQEESPSPFFSVGIDAVNDSFILELSAANLDKLGRERPDLEFFLACLVAKDVTRKLYLMNEVVCKSSTNPKKSLAQGNNNSSNDTKNLLDFHRTNSCDAINTGCKGHVRSKAWTESSYLKGANEGEQLMVVNFELDVPPSLTYLPHNVPVHSVDRSTMAEAQFIAQQKKYWPAGFI